MSALSPELEQELRKLEHMFTVDAAKLKQISLQFEHELRQGLSRVSRCLLPSNVSLSLAVVSSCCCNSSNTTQNSFLSLTNVQAWSRKVAISYVNSESLNP